MTEEIWKPIEGYAYPYEVSNLGNVRGPYGLLAGHVCGTASIVSLIRERGTSATVRIHTLVARAFVPNPEGYRYVRHKDGDRMNCRADNLEWYSKADTYKAPKKPKPKKPPKCPADCIYNGYCYTDTRYCDYYLTTDIRRPCPAGPGCTVYVPNKRPKESQSGETVCVSMK